MRPKASLDVVVKRRIPGYVGSRTQIFQLVYIHSDTFWIP